MPFTVAVWSEGNGDFPVTVEGAAVSCRDLKGLIENSASGRYIGFVAAGWEVFPAEGRRRKEGSNAIDSEDEVKPPAPSGTVHVWVERRAGAGDHFGDERLVEGAGARHPR